MTNDRSTDSTRRVALVTGGSGAIGGEISCHLARAGVRVAVAWHHNADAAHRVVEQVSGAGGEALAVRLDQCDPGDRARALAQVEAELGVVQIVVAAAVAWPTPDDSWEHLVSDLVSNLAGPISLTSPCQPPPPTRRPRVGSRQPHGCGP